MLRSQSIAPHRCSHGPPSPGSPPGSRDAAGSGGRSAPCQRPRRLVGGRGRPTGPGTFTRSRTATNCGLSPACPGVSRNASGRQRSSAARWILLVGPPRERPSPAALKRARCRRRVRRAAVVPPRRPRFGRGSRFQGRQLPESRAIPAACRCARAVAESTLIRPRSAWPWAAASAITASIRYWKTPCVAQIRKRSYALCQGPNSLGRSRQGLPVRNRHITALKCFRRSGMGPTAAIGRWGSFRAHWASVRLPHAMTDGLSRKDPMTQAIYRSRDPDSRQDLVQRSHQAERNSA